MKNGIMGIKVGEARAFLRAIDFPGRSGIPGPVAVTHAEQLLAFPGDRFTMLGLETYKDSPTLYVGYDKHIAAAKPRVDTPLDSISFPLEITVPFEQLGTPTKGDGSLIGFVRLCGREHLFTDAAYYLKEHVRVAFIAAGVIPGRAATVAYSDVIITEVKKGKETKVLLPLRITHQETRVWVFPEGPMEVEKWTVGS